MMYRTKLGDESFVECDTVVEAFQMLAIHTVAPCNLDEATRLLKKTEQLIAVIELLRAQLKHVRANGVPVGFREWTESDIEKRECFDCGLPYQSPAWIEAVVPHDIWNDHISPAKHEGGLLCIGCMANRAVAAGLKDVPVKIAAGPFVIDAK